MAVFGRDPVEQSYTNVITSAAPVTTVATSSTFAYTLPATDGDYDLSMTFDSGSTWPTNGAILTVPYYHGQNQVGFINFQPNGGTACHANTYYGNGGTFIPGFANVWTTTTNTVHVTYHQGRLTLYCNNALVLDQLVPGATQPFSPQFTISNTPIGMNITINSYAVGKMNQYTPTISPSACYGTYGGVTSGNGINHVASPCLNTVYEPVIESSFHAGSLRIPIGTTPAYSNPYIAGDATTGLFSATSSTLSVATNGLERLRVTNAGLAIGTSTPYSQLTLWGPNNLAGTAAFTIANSASTTEFQVFDDGHAVLAGTLTQNSDQRLKTNVTSLDATSSLQSIMGLNPVTFNWIDPSQGTTPQLGFIAQQVQQIFPNLVSTTNATPLTPGGTLGLNYIGLIAPIVEAIKELGTEVQNFAQSFTTQRINTQTLCIGSTCVTETQLKGMLLQGGQSPAVVITSSTTAPSVTATTTDTYGISSATTSDSSSTPSVASSLPSVVSTSTSVSTPSTDKSIPPADTSSATVAPTSGSPIVPVTPGTPAPNAPVTTPLTPSPSAAETPVPTSAPVPAIPTTPASL